MRKRITDADNTALLANTPTKDKSLLHSLQQAAGESGLSVNADKTEYMCFNQKGVISRLNDVSLKLVDKSTYLGSNVTSTKNEISMRLAKAGTTIDRLSIIRMSNLSDKIKHIFFQASVVLILLYGCTTWKKRIEKKLDEICKIMICDIFNKSSKQHPTNQQPYLPPISKTIQIRQTGFAG